MATMVGIVGSGWELLVDRIGIQSHPGDRPRTYGKYQVFIDGQAVADLAGRICECIGPGDNGAIGHDHHLRIHEGRYPLSTQFGELYRSIGYTENAQHPMPGFLVLKTEQRTGILIHPGHPPSLYLSSIGCFNPSKLLSADQEMDFSDSRKRVIDLLESLKGHDQGAFDHRGSTPIADAWLVVNGEPMTQAQPGA